MVLNDQLQHPISDPPFVLGKGVCRCYRAREVRVVLSRQTAASELGVVGVMADVNIEKEVEDLFQGAITNMEGLNVLINNAGIRRTSYLPHHEQ
jgi:NAD(P)-dependent dehydrogenase (short-subunit alcohol dehydrogenase family)